MDINLTWSKEAPKDVGCYFYAFSTEEYGLGYFVTNISKHKKNELRAWYIGCPINGTKLDKMPEKGVWSERVRICRPSDDEFNMLMAGGETEAPIPSRPNFFRRFWLLVTKAVIDVKKLKSKAWK